MRCDQCELMAINGVVCHELGCPNFMARYAGHGVWVKQYECRECGCAVDRGEECCVTADLTD